ncbi:peptidyl-prolyl cis-trans isomerase [Devosia pacifica]|uniref:Parvulin-like PPIase n=1 Tax=Devosia pacifica TaxID=1335967 RepID=A0A918RUX7_9HYPH|nr:peptidylprolyl isomerase [Devosia pacifica]GHA12026.1 peptidyl-prolyl cis-trans isomerase [Devosia pacifica]
MTLSNIARPIKVQREHLTGTPNMLDSLRDFAKSVPGKILGVFLLIGVAGFGINNVILNFGSNTIARVGGEEITAQEFQRAYNSQINQIANQTGRMPTSQEAINMGLPTLVIQRLSQDAALTDLANQFDLGVSDEQLAEMLRNDPSFAGTLGNFDSQRFEQVLQSSGLTESEYFGLQASAARREQLARALFSDITVPDAAAQILARYVGDQRVVDYFVVDRQSVLPPPEPTDAELQAYLAEHQEEFRTPATRTVQVVSLSPEVIAETIEVSEADIEAEYERSRESRTEPERRTVEQIVLDSEDQAETVRQAAESGQPWDELVAEIGLTPSAVGTRARDQFVDESFAEAAFALEEGGYTVIPGVGGQRAIHVSDVIEGGEVSLEDASDEIADQLALQRARDQYIDVLDQVEESRAAFEPLSDIAAEYNLPMTEIDVSASGTELSGISTIPQEQYPRIANEIFAAERDRLSPSITLGANRNVFFELQAINEPADQSLEDVRAEVTKAYRDQQYEEAIDERVAAIEQRLANGASLSELAIEFNLFAETSQPFTRQGLGGTPIDAQVADAVFAGGADHYGVATSGSGQDVVFQVTNTIAAEDGPGEQLEQAFSEDLRLDVLASFVTGVREAAGLSINQQALQQVIGADSGAQ